jgi:hypothetical protein
MRQEPQWKNEKTSERKGTYKNAATAKRFSSTTEYTDQYITDPKNHRPASFLPFDYQVVKFSFAFISIYLQGTAIFKIRRPRGRWKSEKNGFKFDKPFTSSAYKTLQDRGRLSLLSK